MCWLAGWHGPRKAQKLIKAQKTKKNTKNFKEAQMGPEPTRSTCAQRHTYIHSTDTITYIHTYTRKYMHRVHQRVHGNPGHHQEQIKDKAKLPTGSITWRAAHHNQNCRPKGKHTHIHDRLRGGPNNSSCPLFSRHCHRRGCLHIWILTSLGSSSAQATRSSEFNAGTGSA